MYVNHPAAVPQSLGSGGILVLRGIKLLLNVDTGLNAELSWKYLKFLQDQSEEPNGRAQKKRKMRQRGQRQAPDRVLLLKHVRLAERRQPTPYGSDKNDLNKLES